MVVLSNVGNKYICAAESSFGVTPDPFTPVDWGQIQSISVREEENTSKLGSLNSGHIYSVFEDGLYWANVTVETRVTQASLPNLLEFCLGRKTIDETSNTYSIVSDPSLKSVSLKLNYSDTKILLINGVVCKDFELSASKDETIVITMNCIAKKVTVSAATISVSTNTDAPFSWLDTKITINGHPAVLNSFTLSCNWNVSDNEGRGIEAVASGDRRLIQTVIKHRLDISGSYEAELDDTNLEFGYVDNRTDDALVVTLSRGTNNSHVFTLSNARSTSKEYNHSIENSKKVVSYDYNSLDITVSGDLKP